MISLYTGTPGSGKSLHAAYEVIRQLNKGKKVITNYPLNLPKYYTGSKQKRAVELHTYIPNSKLTVAKIKEFALKNHKPNKEHQSLLIIDECASMFNSRSWDRADRTEWIEFFQLHRKLGYDVLLISQHDRLIDRQIRAFVETEYRHRALKHYQLFGLILSLLCGGLFVCVEYWYGTRLKCGAEYFLVDRKKAAIYDTYEMIAMS